LHVCPQIQTLVDESRRLARGMSVRKTAAKFDSTVRVFAERLPGRAVEHAHPYNAIIDMPKPRDAI